MENLNYIIGYLEGLVSARCGFDHSEFKDAIMPVIDELKKLAASHKGINPVEVVKVTNLGPPKKHGLF